MRNIGKVVRVGGAVTHDGDLDAEAIGNLVAAQAGVIEIELEDHEELPKTVLELEAVVERKREEIDTKVLAKLDAMVASLKAQEAVEEKK